MVISQMILADTRFETFSFNDGLLFECDRLYIPPIADLRTRVLSLHHDCTVAGHFGMDKTEDLTTRSFYWPEIQRDIRAYVRTCPKCQANKPSNRVPGGLLQPYPSPTNPGSRLPWTSSSGSL
jgi:hypothetical protein